ncbi:protein kinase domain-containing protein [Streptomyces sp. WMMC905]|uniref:serine/threonine protein kinase n=1 Tax=Streptomyces sp. WMMC905 TaxID=3404123 RepID=UPI003B94DF08
MGEVFAGRYELVDPIGRGGVGAVWRAWDHRRRRYVAAKVLQQRDAHALLRFVREQGVRIDHPHVLAPASWAADDDQVLFTMDLVRGGSLVHLVGDYGPLPPGFVCVLLDQLLSGLAAVHADGVVHRDVKPANVLLEATGGGIPRLRLSDFGIAMRLGEPRLTESDLVVGTPGYLAPEQMLGAEPDFPADLFAVGLVALYLLEGTKADTKVLVEYFAEHGTPPAPRGIPEPLWQVVSTLLQPDPAARFRTATGARKALAQAVELLPEPGPDDERIEVFDQVGPLPPGFGPDGPLVAQREPSTSARDGEVGGSEVSGPPASAGADDVSSGVFVLQPPAPPPAPPLEGPPSWPSGSAVPPGSADVPWSRFPEGGHGTPPPPPAFPPAGRPPESGRTGEARSPVAGPVPGDGPASGEPWDTGERDDARSSPAEHGLGSGAAYASRASGLPAEERPGGERGSGEASSAPTGAGATATYTARPQRHHRATRVRRPGPPARLAAPLLLVALVCYGVGFWALARI